MKFAHFSLDLYTADSNHIIGLVAKLLWDLEKPLASSLGVLFENSGGTQLFDVVLKGKEVCVKALDTNLVPIHAQKLPPFLHVQLDNCWRITKVGTYFILWSLIVAKSICEEAFVSFLSVEYIHEDINATFGRWNKKLHENNYFLLPSLMHLFMLVDPNA